jgi:DNA processing protein
MAGYSHAVLVIEAQAKSGTLITSRLATDYNKDVLAVPGSVFSLTSEGPHLLIRLGATPITKSTDILEALGFELKESGPRNLELEYSDCSPPEKKIIQALTEPKTRDEIMREIDLPTNEINMLLSIMELKGLIAESLGEIHLV